MMMLYLTCRCASHSSEESAKAKTQKEVIKTLKELKLHLPAEKRHGNKSTTLSTLKYALRCVKQVEGKSSKFSLLVIVAHTGAFAYSDVHPSVDGPYKPGSVPGFFLLKGSVYLPL